MIRSTSNATVLNHGKIFHIGGLAGAPAGRVVDGGGFGLLGDIIVGIVGALLGGWVLGLLVNDQVGVIGSFVTAFIGACLLLWVARLFTGNTRARV